MPAAMPTEKPVARLRLIQINRSGAWQNVLPFDANDVPEEAFDHFDKFLRLMGGDHITARVVLGKSSDCGKTVGTQAVLMTWSRPKGWVTL